MNGSGASTGWEPLFWLVFQRSSNGISLIDDQRRFVEANDAMLALVGRSRGELLGTPVITTITPSERVQSQRDWHSFLQSGEYMGTRTFSRPDGSEVTADFAARNALVGGRRLAIYVVSPGDDLTPSSPSVSSKPALTDREREVVTLISLGHETNTIAQELHVSRATVRRHVRNAMCKLGAHTRAHLVAIAICCDDALHLPQLGE
jgi:PAS domain S-box-containing protein